VATTTVYLTLSLPPIDFTYTASPLDTISTTTASRTSILTAHPITGRFTPRATQADEYEIDAVHARITFGRLQKSGSKLAVVHWIVTWRDDIEGVACHGFHKPPPVLARSVSNRGSNSAEN
jgi:hypothetical protein